jgi:hypothetical protein
MNLHFAEKICAMVAAGPQVSANSELRVAKWANSE